MKKLIFGIVVIILVTIGYSWYQNMKKFNPPNGYDYIISDEIDINYHNPITVQNYIENCFKIGQFARNQWFNNGFDVKFADSENEQSIIANKVYNTLLSTTTLIEKRLEQSAKLKSQGFDNNQIKEIELKGLNPDNYYWKSQFKNTSIEIGERGDHVTNIQEILIADSIKIKLDGVFSTETELAIQKYQKKHNIYPSGKINELTLIEMYKTKKHKYVR